MSRRAEPRTAQGAADPEEHEPELDAELDQPEPRAVRHERAIDRGETVLEADHVAESDPVDRQRVQAIAGGHVVWDLLQRRDPREFMAERHVLAVRNQMHVAVFPHHVPSPIEQDPLVVDATVGRPHDGTGDGGNSHGADRRRDLGSN